MESKNNSSKISDEITNLVIARLETIPPNIQISIGGDGSFTIEELIKRVKAQDSIGKKMIEMQLSYLRSLNKLPTQGLNNATFAN